MKPGDGPNHLQPQKLVKAMLASRGEVERRKAAHDEERLVDLTQLDTGVCQSSLALQLYPLRYCNHPLLMLTSWFAVQHTKEPLHAAYLNMYLHHFAILSTYSARTQLIFNISEAFRDDVRRCQSRPCSLPFPALAHAAARMVPLSANLGFPP